MLPLDAPNTEVGAKAVDVGAANRLPAAVAAEGAPTEPTPLLTVLGATPKALVVLETLLNRLPVLATEVEEPLEAGLVKVVVVMGGEREVNGEPPAGAETFVEAGLILGKNGLAVLVAEKADAEPVDKLSRLLAAVVARGAVLPDLAPPRERSSTPPGKNAGAVAEAPKMLLVSGNVLAEVVDDTTLDLLLSDKACAKTPPTLTPKPDGVITAVVLVSLFSDGVPLKGRET